MPILSRGLLAGNMSVIIVDVNPATNNIDAAADTLIFYTGSNGVPALWIKMVAGDNKKSRPNSGFWGNTFNVAGLPDATNNSLEAGDTAWCTNGNAGSAAACTFDGTDWRVNSTGSVVSAT